MSTYICGCEGSRIRDWNLDGELVRSWLLVAADRPAEIDAAIGQGVYQLIVDLSTRTAPVSHALRNWLTERGVDPPIWVRINEVGSSEWADDVAAIAASKSVKGVMLSHTQDALEVEITSSHVGEIAVVPIIESRVGLDNARSIVESWAVSRLALGDIIEPPDEGPVDRRAARQHLADVSRAHRRPAPIDISRVHRSPAGAHLYATEARCDGMGGIAVHTIPEMIATDDAYSVSIATLTARRPQAGPLSSDGVTVS